MTKIRCVVERITYQNPENGYSVLKVHVKGYDDLVTVVGNLLDANVGSVLLIEGEWKVDSRYGRQFMAEKWEETLPATVYGMEKYLGSGLIKGVGPKYARKIVQKYGVDTFAVIEDNIELLVEIPGIGHKRIRMIAESWKKQKEVKNIMLFLQEHGVSTAFAARIYKQYGNESISVMKENPFRLADDIWGIGFRTADHIAEKLGFGKEAYVRLRSGIMYTLSELADEGHVYGEREQLTEKAAALLEADDGCIVMTMDQMLKDKDLIREEDAIYLPPFYYAEAGTAGKLRKLASAPAGDRLWIRLEKARRETGNDSLSVDVERIEQAVGMQYDEIQGEAIRRAALAKVMILTGGPGTGKTTTTQGIIAAYRAYGLKILLAAPTGRAAKRMSEECSMIDIIMMNSLLKAIPPGMRLILVGDIDQLPSVGAGNVLRDMIASGRFPVIRLTRIFRQALASRIIRNAHRINGGQMPDLSNGKDTDFFFLEREEPEAAAAEIVKLVKEKLPRYYGMQPSMIQVLTPMQRGVAGATNLNLMLQEAINPQGEGLRRSGFIFRPGDRVMQIKNNYDKDVFNGDIGMIETVDLTDRTLSVAFDQRKIIYDATELDELVHAYATTIHKAQGSEYPIVVMPVLMTHFVMLQRNLIYTGITRAKKVLVMVGTRKALSYAVGNVTVTERNTMLAQRLGGSEVL